jgi:hypothetical protein
MVGAAGADTADTLARCRREADTPDTLARCRREADTPDTLARCRREADTPDTLVRCRREADTSSAEVGGNSVAAHREHIEIGVAANGVAVNGVAATGAAALTGAAATGATATGATATGAAATGAAATGVGTPRGAGAFLTPLTTAIFLMGITLGIRTDLVIPFTGVGTHIGPGAFPFTHTRTTALILPIGTLTIALYQEGDSFDVPPL